MITSMIVRNLLIKLLATKYGHQHDNQDKNTRRHEDKCECSNDDSQSVELISTPGGSPSCSVVSPGNGTPHL